MYCQLLAPSQVYEVEHTGQDASLPVVPADEHAEQDVTSRRLPVHVGLGVVPTLFALLELLGQSGEVFRLYFDGVFDLELLVTVFRDDNSVLFPPGAEQVIDYVLVDLNELHLDLEELLTLCHLREEVLHGQPDQSGTALVSEHRVGLAAARLAVHEHRLVNPPQTLLHVFLDRVFEYAGITVLAAVALVEAVGAPFFQGNHGRFV